MACSMRRRPGILGAACSMRRRLGISGAAALFGFERRGGVWVPSHPTRDGGPDVAVYVGHLYADMSVVVDDPGISLISTVHGLVACGGEDGAVDCFDLRKKSSVGRINAVAPTGDFIHEVTALQFYGAQGYLMAVGNSAGKVSIYDLRMSDPI
ncbi:NUC153 domain [Musa troglodytarum]|uniref:NUC153 domain n=1 Tax=Musa troglodytarum TaxID=320322 RepID=A0A9E7EK42_9LILI|nr:NUC153 domain [Musa troglodytarum]